MLLGIKSRKVKRMKKYMSSVEEHSVRVEALPKGVVDFTEERMLA